MKNRHVGILPTSSCSQSTMCRNCPKEFNEGDVGLAGGIQVSEPANANLVTEDSDFGFWENFYGFLVFLGTSIHSFFTFNHGKPPFDHHVGTIFFEPP